MTNDDRRLLELAIQIKDCRNAPPTHKSGDGFWTSLATGPCGDALQEAFNLLRDTRGASATHVPNGWVGFLRLVGIPMNRAHAEMMQARRAKLSHVAAQP